MRRSGTDLLRLHTTIEEKFLKLFRGRTVIIQASGHVVGRTNHGLGQRVSSSRIDVQSPDIVGPWSCRLVPDGLSRHPVLRRRGEKLVILFVLVFFGFRGQGRRMVCALGTTRGDYKLTDPPRLEGTCSLHSGHPVDHDVQQVFHPRHPHAQGRQRRPFGKLSRGKFAICGGFQLDTSWWRCARASIWHAELWDTSREAVLTWCFPITTLFPLCTLCAGQSDPPLLLLIGRGIVVVAGVFRRRLWAGRLRGGLGRMLGIVGSMRAVLTSHMRAIRRFLRHHGRECGRSKGPFR